MNREDVIRWARETGLIVDSPYLMPHDHVMHGIERFAALVAAASASVEREAFPDLTPVINWLENGCDPKEAAKELRLYAAAIRARGQK